MDCLVSKKVESIRTNLATPHIYRMVVNRSLVNEIHSAWEEEAFAIYIDFRVNYIKNNDLRVCICKFDDSFPTTNAYVAIFFVGH